MLPLLEFAYNQTPNSTTGVAPFEAQQGYLPSIPTSLLAATSRLPTANSPTVTKFIKDIRQTYQAIYTKMREVEAKQEQLIRTRENATRREHRYKVGDEVLVYWEPFGAYTNQLRKQRFKYQGPFVITEVKPPHCVRLDGLPERMPDMINVEYVHLYKRTTSLELQQLRGD